MCAPIRTVVHVHSRWFGHTTNERTNEKKSESILYVFSRRSRCRFRFHNTIFIIIIPLLVCKRASQWVSVRHVRRWLPLNLCSLALCVCVCVTFLLSVCSSIDSTIAKQLIHLCGRWPLMAPNRERVRRSLTLLFCCVWIFFRLEIYSRSHAHNVHMLEPLCVSEILVSIIITLETRLRSSQCNSWTFRWTNWKNYISNCITNERKNSPNRRPDRLDVYAAVFWFTFVRTAILRVLDASVFNDARNFNSLPCGFSLVIHCNSSCSTVNSDRFYSW